MEDKSYGIYYQNEKAVVHFAIQDEMFHVYRVDERGLWYFYDSDDDVWIDYKFKTVEEALPFFLLASI